MAILKRRFGINTSKFFLILILSFLTIQLVSWALSEVMDYPLLKMGWMILLFLVVIGVITLFVLGKNITQLTLKKEGLFMIIIFAIIILAFIYLPNIIPQIFSTQSLEIGEYVKGIIGTIIKMGPGVVRVG